MNTSSPSYELNSNTGVLLQGFGIKQKKTKQKKTTKKQQHKSTKSNSLIIRISYQCNKYFIWTKLNNSPQEEIVYLAQFGFFV